MNKQKGFVVQGIIAVIVLVLVAIGAYYIGGKNNDSMPEVNRVMVTDKENSNIADWKTYSDSTTGFKVDYPANWKTVRSEANGTVSVLNPQRQGKDDMDQPSELVRIGFSQAPCVKSDWKAGSGLISYKTVCINIRGQNITISATAFDNEAKTIVDRIISTFVLIQ